MGILKDLKPQPKQETMGLGGKRAVIFVYAMQGFDTMAFLANALSLVTYFSQYMNFSFIKSATTLTNFAGTTFMLAVVGGFISDTYLTRFTTCVLFAFIELVGYALRTLQAHYDQLRPIPCKFVAPNQSNQLHCEAANSGQEAVLFTGLYLVALGTSGVKAVLPALGADQFDDKDPEEAAQLSSFFNWFLLSLAFGAILGLTFIVWISKHQGWDWGFGVCAAGVLLAIVFLCMGKSFFRHNALRGSAFVRVLQVFVAAIRNRRLPIPRNAEELHEIDCKEAEAHYDFLPRTDQFRFLDRAVIAKSNTDESTSRSLCTVTQVEETKILLRLLPVILSTVFLNTCLAQLQTFSIHQSTTMDPSFLGFEVPNTFIPTIPLLFILALIPLYNQVFVPLARKLTGIPTGIRHLQRIGKGLVLSDISMAVSGAVEAHRKSVAVEHNMVDSAEPSPMSVFWLGFQFSIFGAVDMFSLVGLLELLYAESSAGMKSLSTAITWCSMSLGFFLSIAIMKILNKVTGGWLAHDNLNRDKLDYFYYLLSVLSVINFAVYLVIASWYKYKVVEMKPVENSNAADAERKAENVMV